MIRNLREEYQGNERRQLLKMTEEKKKNYLLSKKWMVAL